jgi:hypothetical protein
LEAYISSKYAMSKKKSSRLLNNFSTVQLEV